MLQDIARPSIKRAIGGMELVTPLQTVGSALEAVGATALLSDADINAAVVQLPPGFTAEHVETKAKAHAALVAKYGGDSEARARVVDRCLVSIGDAIALIDNNRLVTQKLVCWLDTWFRSGGDKNGTNCDLTITRGTGGSMLSHSHSQQYNYARESLLLWDFMQRDIFSMWEAVESDMLVNHTDYRQMNTGQGVHRVSGGTQSSACIGRAVANAQAAQHGLWVGIQVIHMSDRDVPNPLVAIEKYTMIPRMLEPIVRCVEEVAREFDLALPGSPARAAAAKAAKSAKASNGDAGADAAAAAGGPPEKYPGYRQLLLLGQESPEQLIIGMLRDFFRYGFCGSGDDGGSCIDGRSTSFYEWTTLIAKKSYYQCMTLTGFTGFGSNYNS
jgi:hypothetical protein